MKQPQRSISKTFLTTMLLSTYVSAAILIACWVYGEITDFNEDAKRIRTDYIDTQKATVRTEVVRAVDTIDYWRTLAKQRYPDLPEDALMEDIFGRISQTAFGRDGEGFVFVGDFDGVELVNRKSPHLIGKNFWEMEDAHGLKVFQEQINLAKTKPEGDFLTYWWSETKDPEDARPKMSFVKGVPGLKLFVGAGVNLGEVEAVIAEKRGHLIKDLTEQALIILLAFGTLSVVSFCLFKRFADRMKKNFDVFVAFFEEAAEGNDRINPEKLHYREFGELASFANDMVTARQRAEKALHMTQHSVDNAAFEVYWITEDARFAYVNDRACESLGYSRKELLALGVTDVDPDFDMERWKEHWKELSERESFTIETQHRHKNGRVYPVEVTINYLEFDGKGYNFAYATEITERKRIQMERETLLKTVESKNKELQSIVYTASHDLKSPLVNIRGFSGELARSCESLRDILTNENQDQDMKNSIQALLNEDIPEALKFIAAGVDKMKVLLDGLLQVSRIGSANIRIDTLDMNKLMTDVITPVRFQINNTHTDISFDSLPNCMGDTAQINQVFTNLIDNALKYLDPTRKSSINISGRIEDNQSIYCVADNGIGMRPEYREKIFELFHRLDPTGPVDGEGLGLTIIVRILDRHSGKIWVESEPGNGSKFFVSLPNTPAATSIEYLHTEPCMNT